MGDLPPLLRPDVAWAGVTSTGIPMANGLCWPLTRSRSRIALPLVVRPGSLMGRSRILSRTLQRSSRALRLALTPSRVSRAAGGPNTSSSRCARLGRGSFGLRPRVEAAPPFFPVDKSSGKQRVVWNGTRVSLAAARPPPPKHLADPAAFGMLDLAAASRLRITKRDCRSWFGQLEVHSSMGILWATAGHARRAFSRRALTRRNRSIRRP